VLLSLMGIGACSDAMTSASRGAGASREVTVSYCPATVPTWAAYQDGAGTWTRVVPASDFTIHFPLFTGRGGLATVSRDPLTTATALSVQYATADEFAAAAPNHSPCTIPSTIALFGTVSGLNGATHDGAVISFGSGSAELSSAVGGPNFFVVDRSNGPRDLVAVRSSTIADAVVATGIIIRRTLNLANGDTLPPLDFSSAEALVPAAATLTLGNVNLSGTSSQNVLLTANGTVGALGQRDFSTTTTRQYQGVSDAQLATGDLHQLFVTTSDGMGNRTETLWFRNIRDRRVTLGAPLQFDAPVSVTTQPYPRLRAQLPSYGEYNRSANVVYGREDGSSITLVMTAAYARLGDIGYDLVVPDLTAAAGFDLEWALASRSPFFWVVEEKSSSSGSGLGPLVPADGASSLDAQRFGFFAAPSRAP